MGETSGLEGWGFPRDSSKAHYFLKDGRSLCNKWGFYHGDKEQGNDESADNCTACKKALRHRKERERLDELKKRGKMEL